MAHNFQFLPLEVQTSIAELRTLGVPSSAIDLLIQRIIKASEAKTTSLQMDIVRIEEAVNRRLDRIGEKLQADLQTQHGATNAMLVDVRAAQMVAHPQIDHLSKSLEDIDVWTGRLEKAFIQGRDYAAAERARLEAKIDQLDGRLSVVEGVLEIEPKTDA